MSLGTYNSRPPYAGDVIHTAKSRQYVEVLEVEGYRTIDGMDIYHALAGPLVPLLFGKQAGVVRLTSLNPCQTPVIVFTHQSNERQTNG
ncbi:hypothetical protein EBZ39_14510 [bacterium]|nr:hypothetical protein [bacterium]